MSEYTITITEGAVWAGRETWTVTTVGPTYGAAFTTPFDSFEEALEEAVAEAEAITEYLGS